MSSPRGAAQRGATAWARAVAAAAVVAGVAACDCGGSPAPPSCARAGPDAAPRRLRATDDAGGEADARWAAARRKMVAEQLVARGIVDGRVLAAMSAVPRHLFVPPDGRAEAYGDFPLPIGLDQTISQPYVVAYMTQALEVREDARILEIGTGSGYQAAVLARLCREVYSIEVVPDLSARAASTFASLAIGNVSLRVGDGYRGWPEKAPFDGIVVTAAPPEIPQPLVDQLAVGGRMIVPVGDLYQDLVLIERTEDGVRTSKVLPVRFVPMTGEAQRRRGP
jgi:protein-L-isoaspartate(D-aspartate) O-methyltransferase